MAKVKVSLKEAEKAEIADAATNLSVPLSAFLRIAALEKARRDAQRASAVADVLQNK